ncbi:MAG: TetR family transcriptional regulator [Kiritimatiellaeota bacterium]|nr:TetR family transcriptional regulator [Kiritimatiellota bacterium]
MARRTKAEAERTRQRILRTALGLFLKKGYARATFTDVAEGIGLSKGAGYWHFKSKPDLLMALAERMMERHGVALAGMCHADSLEALRDDLLARAERVVGNAECRRFFKMVSQMDLSSRQGRPLRMWITRHDRGVFAGILRTLEDLKERGRLRPGVDAKVAATVLAVMWSGLVRAKVDHGPEVDLRKAIVFGFDMAVNAMGV